MDPERIEQADSEDTLVMGKRLPPAMRQDGPDVKPTDSDVTVREAAVTAPRIAYLDVGMRTDRGRVRDHNEDSALVWEVAEGEKKGGMFAVADGLGGRSAGEVASDLVTRKLLQLAQEQWPSSKEPPQVANAFKSWIADANDEVYRAAAARHNGMATTLTAGLVLDHVAFVGNVGDSRTYLLHNAALTPVSHDHSYVMRLVDAGMIKPEEIYTHPRRNVIDRALGVNPSVEADVFGPIDLEPGDQLLLCSDGLWEKVHDPDLLEILTRIRSAQDCCDELVRLANAAGGQDNITALIVRVI